MKNDFLFVIVLYRQQLNDSMSFNSLTLSLKETKCDKMDLFIYDNSPHKQKYSKECCYFWNIHYIHDPTNPGVSKAYNEGFIYAQTIGKSWIFLADQDTIFPLNTIQLYIQSSIKYPTLPILCPIIKSSSYVISPSHYFFRRGFHYFNYVKVGLLSLKGKTMINSGLAINASAFIRTGGYNEKIKLDFSDFYFLQQIKKIYSHALVVDVVCIQNLSSTHLTSIENAITRFKYYIMGAKNFSNNIYDTCILLPISFLRAIILAITYRRLVFLYNWIKLWLTPSS